MPARSFCLCQEPGSLPRWLCSSVRVHLWPGWTDGSHGLCSSCSCRTFPRGLGHVSSGSCCTRHGAQSSRNHHSKVLREQLEEAPSPLRTVGAAPAPSDAGGLERCLGGQVVADLAALGRSSPASLQMLFRTLQIFIYYVLEATTLNLHFCDSRRTRGSLETLGGCCWGCGIWC